jgi:hypothetical protein
VDVQSRNMVVEAEAPMRNHIHLIEMLPISVVNRANARADYDAAEASIDHVIRALAWLRECGSVAIYTAASMAMAVGVGMALSSFVPT